ncbi:MAG TPA: ethanolamine ammonia-lyase subunit EutC [Granulicella sp.]|nr:ethanolamine ammonia-lyase subunit EutC [Granulicella sp.]
MSNALHPIPTELRAFTPARIALARTGASLTTRDALAFTLAHAQARDAVHAALSLPSLHAALHARKLPFLSVKSAAPDRATYLRRPDLGRTLSDASRTLLARESLAPTESAAAARSLAAADTFAATQAATAAEAPRLTIILADGLSALATDRHALPLLDALLPLLAAEPWQLTPIVLAEQARVALGDEIGQALRANLTLMLLGERPGLSAADSLGAYITWAPAPGRTDAQRNCVSNIRSGGLDPAAAAHRITHYLHQSLRLSLSGIALKDPAESTSVPLTSTGFVTMEQTPKLGEDIVSLPSTSFFDASISPVPISVACSRESTPAILSSQEPTSIPRISSLSLPEET